MSAEINMGGPMIAYRDKPGGPLKGPITEMPSTEDIKAATEIAIGLLHVIAGERESHAATLDMLADHQDKQDNPEAARINRRWAHLLREYAAAERRTTKPLTQAHRLLTESPHPIPAPE